MSIPGYISRALARFKTTLPTRPQHLLHACIPIHYGKAFQLTNPINVSPLLTPPEIREIQNTVDVLLYYARTVDSILLVALNTIGSQQSKATKKTQNAVTHLLQYCASNPDATVRYHESDVVLHVHSDASYLFCLQAQSRVGCLFFLSFQSNNPSRPPFPQQKLLPSTDPFTSSPPQ